MKGLKYLGIYLPKETKGGRFRFGNSFTLVVDSRQCMAKPIQYCKVKKKKMGIIISTFWDTWRINEIIYVKWHNVDK